MRRLFLGGLTLLALSGAGPAFGADIPAPVYKAPVMVPVPYSWTGFYIGGNVGYSWGRGQTDFSDITNSTVAEFRGVPPLTACAGLPPGACPPLPAGFGATTVGTASGRAGIDGVLGGLQAGYNWQNNSFVYGLEVDIQATGERGSVFLCDTAGCPLGSVSATASYKLPWFATFRGRVGITPTPKLLLYVTGGLAVGQVDADYTAGLTGVTPAVLLSDNTTRAGWALGVGGEGAIGDTNWTLKVEYLHLDFGSFTSPTMTAGTTATTLSNFPGQGFSTVVTSTTTAAFNSRVTDDLVRVGLNYRFVALPVVTRY